LGSCVIGLTVTVGLSPPAAAEELVGPPPVEAEEAVEPQPAPAPAPERKLRKPTDGPIALKPRDEGIGWGAKAGFIGVAAIGAYLFYRRRGPGGLSLPLTPLPKVVGRTALHGRSSLVVVEVEGQRLLLGVTPSQITTLTVLSDELKVGASEIEEPSRDASVLRESPVPTATRADRAEPSAMRNKSGFAPASSRTQSVEDSLNRLLANARAEAQAQESRTPRSVPGVYPTSRSTKRELPPEEIDEGRDWGMVLRELETVPPVAVGAGRRGGRGRDVGQLEGQVRGLGKRGA
jgi:flagellar biogenesis protein FliO